MRYISLKCNAMTTGLPYVHNFSRHTQDSAVWQPILEVPFLAISGGESSISEEKPRGKMDQQLCLKKLSEI